MPQEIQALSVLFDKLIEFVVAYGFQILGSLVVLFIGLKIAGWSAKKIVAISTRRELDPTLGKFAGNVVRVLLVAIVIVITLSNFGITIAPFIALAGAASFGVTLALQGPLSNYGAGLVIILTRPFAVGDTIQVQGSFGVVEDISLAATVLIGEDGERITVPNKEIVGQIIVNSHGLRVVETKLFVDAGQDPEKAMAAIRQALTRDPLAENAPSPQIGIHDFAYGGVVVGARYWVPSQKYFETRYRLNGEALSALGAAGIKLMAPAAAAVLAPALQSEEAPNQMG